MNHLQGTVEAGGRVRVGNQSLPIDGPVPAVGTVVQALVRPEAVKVAAAQNAPTVVAAATFRGATTRLRLLAADGTEVLADLASHQAGALGAGAQVSMTLLDRPVLLAAQ